jgi:GntR family transcriptional regulator
MRTEIDRWDPEPVYAQLADILRGQIERRELVPRQPLPSETYLVQHYGVSRGTARRAVAVLRDERLVRTIAQRGTYVVPADDRGAAG